MTTYAAGRARRAPRRSAPRSMTVWPEFFASSLAERLFLVSLVMGQVYYFHRWLFRYNDTGTSPTYSDTPALWQAAKYPIILALAALCAFALGRRRGQGTVRDGGYAFATSLLLVAMLCVSVYALGEGSTGLSSRAKDWFFLPLVLLMPQFWRGERSLLLLLRTTGLLTLYHLAFSAVQIVAYSLYGRLPGLAYRGSLVRFGGGLDDPNGFGVLLVLPVLLLLAGWPFGLARKIKISLLAALFVLETLTVSFSAAGAMVVGLAAFTVLARQSIKGLGLAFLGFLVGVYAVSSGYAERIYGQKALSASTRFALSPASADESTSFAAFLRDATWSDWLFGATQGTYHSETAYFHLLEKYGLVVALLIAALGIATVGAGVRQVRRLFQAGNDVWAKVFAALTAFEVAFLVGSLGVPYFSVFPVNVLFWTVGMILWMPFLPDAALPGTSTPSRRKHRVD